MATDIRTANTSAFIQLGSKFRSIEQKEKVYVYVEDDMDIPFWRRFFKKHEERYEITIQPLQINQKELRGKTSLLSKIDLATLGPNKIICIDSDFDLIIPEYSVYSNDILSNKYIITTHLYSIESFKCHRSNLKQYIYQSTLCNNIVEDIDQIVSDFSILISNLFLILLVSIYKKDSFYSLADFRNDLSNITYSKRGFEKSKAYIQERINKMARYQALNSTRIIALESYLKTCTFDRNDYYLLINGHDLMNIIIIPTLKFIARPLRSNKISLIKKLQESEERKKTLLEQYYNQTGISAEPTNSLCKRIKQLVNDCTSYDIGSPCTIIQASIDDLYVTTQ